MAYLRFLPKPSKKEKNCRKPRDKLQNLWYNKYVIKRGKPLLKIKKGGDLSADERRKI